MFDVFGNYLTITATLVTRTALRVGAGRVTAPTGTALPIVKDWRGRPFIPGASFKGALRARTEALVRAVVPGKWGACNLFDDKETCLPRQEVSELQKKAQERGDQWLAGELLPKTCLTCATFGAPWLASSLRVKDLSIEEATWLGQTEVRNGVAIDRDTETVSGTKLYDYEVLPAGTRFTFELVLENAEDWQRGLLLAGLAAFERGEAALGGFRSRGLGWAQLTDLQLTLFSPGNGSGATPTVRDYLLPRQGNPASEAQQQECRRMWRAAFRSKLAECAREAKEERDA